MISPSTALGPQTVHSTIAKHLLCDGFDFVLDLEKSHGCTLVDARSGREFVDFFSFFASSPLGMNHPAMNDPDFLHRLGRVAQFKPSNSDVYTVELATFVDRFSRFALPADLSYLFFVEGGALAVENALKAAFDWKVRKNLANGRGEKGSRVMHFRQAFHGRSGYTLSLTNTADPRKTAYFPKFDWPRILNPKITFPLEGANVDDVLRAEAEAMSQMRQAFADHPDDIAAIIIEPIQGEGGDNHFRGEFLRALRELADEMDCLLAFDEIQTGIGLTGSLWAFEHFGVVPDLLVFGKKTQVCGFAASRRLDEVPDNVFHVSSRINSTWGGNLTDMVRATRYLEVIEEQALVARAAMRGEYLKEHLRELQESLGGYVTQVRGRGLMVAFDLPTPEDRDRLRASLYRNGVLMLPCGVRSLRFRPALTISTEEIDRGLEILRRTVSTVSQTTG